MESPDMLKKPKLYELNNSPKYRAKDIKEKPTVSARKKQTIPK